MKKKTNNKTQKTIYYTGIGSTKNKKEFTDNEFTDVMNKNFKQSCKIYKSHKKLNPCKEGKKLVGKMLNPPSKYNNEKTNNKLKKLLQDCDKLSKKEKECNLQEYIDFSGAIKKK